MTPKRAGSESAESFHLSKQTSTFPRPGTPQPGPQAAAGTPLRPPSRRSPTGRVTATRILSGLWALQPDPEAALSGGPGTHWRTAPPPPPQPLLGVPGAFQPPSRRPRGKGRDGASRDPALLGAGRGRPCRPPAPRFSLPARNGDGARSARCPRFPGGRGWGGGGAHPPKKTGPRPGQGSPWASRSGRDPAPPPQLLGHLQGHWDRPPNRSDGETEARGGRRLSALLGLSPAPLVAIPRPEVLTGPQVGARGAATPSGLGARRKVSREEPDSPRPEGKNHHRAGGAAAMGAGERRPRRREGRGRGRGRSLRSTP